MLKKSILLLTVFLTGNFLYAQDDPFAMDPIIGSQSGNMMFEITATPFEGSSLLDFGSMRIRAAVSDLLVPRLGINMHFNSEQETPDYVSNWTEYEVRPGLEFHLTRESSFRSYTSLDFIIGQRHASIDSKSSTSPSVSGSIQVPTRANMHFSDSQRGHFRLGFGLGFGADYYFNAKFYVGAEIGLEFYNDTMSEVSVDGELFQEELTIRRGGVNTQNALKVGFILF